MVHLVGKSGDVIQEPSTIVWIYLEMTDDKAFSFFGPSLFRDGNVLIVCADMSPCDLEHICQ